MQVLTSLHQQQVRLGYLNVVSLVASRSPESHGALLRRFQDVVFRRVYVDEPMFQDFTNLVDSRRLASKLKGERAGLDVSELWTMEQVMPSNLNLMTQHHSKWIIDLARDTNIVGPAYELTETGVVLRLLNQDVGECIRSAIPEPNPLWVGRHLALQVFLLMVLLRADAVIPHLVAESAGSESVPADVLLAATQRLIDAAARGATINDALALKEIRRLLVRITDSNSVRRNQTRPRREWLVDLGLLEKSTKGSRGEGYYKVTAAGIRAAKAWQELLNAPWESETLLRTRFFQWTNKIYAMNAVPVSDDEFALAFFVNAFRQVGRPIGFTPGRTVATLACLSALESGRIIELEQMNNTVYAAARGPLRSYLEFSGGSRFDREFLIRVRPGLEDHLPPAVAS